MLSGLARLVAGSVLLALVACGSPQEKASKAATRFDIYYARGDYYSARKEIERALGAQDDVPEYWARLARVELADGRYLQAYDAYNRLIELAPNDKEAIQAMAELSYSGGSFDDAEKLADQILKDQPRSLRMLLVKGSVAASIREPAKAQAIATQMLEIDPSNEGAKILLSRALNQQGHAREAVTNLQESLDKDGESGPKLMALLDLYAGAEDFPRQARTFARLFMIYPDNFDIRLEYVRLLYERGLPDRALEMLARLVRQRPDDVNLQQAIVDLWTGIGAAGIDIERVRRFVLARGDRTMKVTLGRLLIDQRRFADAEAVLRPFVDQGDVTAQRVEADVLYAGALAGLGRGAAGQALIDKVLAFDAANPRALLMQVQVATATGDLARALRDAQTLTTDNPRLTEGRIALAEVFVRRKETVLADSAYASAMKELADDPAMLGAYVDYLRRTNRMAMALDTTRRFTRANPRSREGWTQSAELCLEARDGACVDEAFFMLDQVPGGAKVHRQLAPRRALLPAGPPLQEGAPVLPAGQAAAGCGTAGEPC